MSHKPCSRCKEVKPLTGYFRDCTSHSGDGYEYMCKGCTKKFHSGTANGLALARAKNIKRRYLALSHYSGGVPVCACCGERNYEFLAIDHIHGGGHKHRQEIGRAPIEWWLRKNGYPDGFRVLCHNCNLALGHHGICPHTQHDYVWAG